MNPQIRRISIHEVIATAIWEEESNAESDWERAAILFRAGDPSELARLLRTDRRIPSRERALLAEIAEGKAASRKRRSDARLTPRDVIDLCRLWHHVCAFYECARRDASITADQLGKETRHYLQQLAREREEGAAILAEFFDIDPASIPTTVRRFTSR